MAKRKVVTLCGSTRFKDVFDRVNAELTLQGHVVMQPACLWHCNGEEPTAEQRRVLDEVYDSKILMSDEVLVINENNYIGESTRREILFAMLYEKDVRFLHDTEEARSLMLELEDVLRTDTERKLNAARELLREAVLQIGVLHERSKPTATGGMLIIRINSFLNQ